MKTTNIEWTDCVWNPTRGCSMAKGSELGGCLKCYAARDAARKHSNPKLPGYRGFAIFTPNGPRWTGKVEPVESKLFEPLHWRKPRRCFVNSMSDLFHESLPDEAIDRVFAVMALTPHITYQVLTKRAERMRRWFEGDGRPRWSGHVSNRAYSISAVHGGSLPAAWPLLNVWLGVSVENPPTAKERIPELLRTPAAVRFVSYEPALAAVDFTPYVAGYATPGVCRDIDGNWWHAAGSCVGCSPGLDWGIVGGESGPGARPFDLKWARDTIASFRAAGRPLFVKQLGAHPVYEVNFRPYSGVSLPELKRLELFDAMGGDWDEWPAELRVREFPQ